ncbi:MULTISPECIES: hypothetical protein [Sphingomonas]|jgi:hypothetical protein|uniref:hypothetical protein n=1 Tax=Sphingomonas TaxID=13687 RepID=UPI00193BB214|nr:MULTISPECIES: hypothetical protein [Sphingomonas]
MISTKNGNAPLAPSVRANRRLLAISAVFGAVIGVATVFVQLPHSDGAPTMGDLLRAPLPAWFAILIAVAWGIVLPLISWRWERVVDEHERQAYRDGAVAGFYVMGVGAPMWWILARGGLVPAVDAIGLYVATMAATAVVWLWRKYA